MSERAAIKPERPARVALSVLALCFALSVLGRGLGESFTVFLKPISESFGWDRAEGGFYNGLGRDLGVEDSRPSYWSPSEAIGAAAVLATATGNETYWDDYDRAWDYALTHLVDARHGGWFKAPARPDARLARRKGDGLDPDYHPAGACFEALRCLGGDVADGRVAT